MSKKSLLITGAALALCLVAIVPVLAQGQNPIYATIEYVDQRFDEVKTYVDQQVTDLKSYVDEEIAEVYAYVGQEVDRLDERIDQIGDPGPGEDFDVPPASAWSAFYNEGGPGTPFELGPDEPYCTWHNNEVGVTARGVATPDGGMGAPFYGTGGGRYSFIQFIDPPVLDSAEVLEVDVTLHWMEIHKEIHLTLQCGPKQGDEETGWWMECFGQDAGG